MWSLHVLDVCTGQHVASKCSKCFFVHCPVPSSETCNLGLFLWNECSLSKTTTSPSQSKHLFGKKRVMQKYNLRWNGCAFDPLMESIRPSHLWDLWVFDIPMIWKETLVHVTKIGGGWAWKTWKKRGIPCSKRQVSGSSPSMQPSTKPAAALLVNWLVCGQVQTHSIMCYWVRINFPGACWSWRGPCAVGPHDALRWLVGHSFRLSLHLLYFAGLCRRQGATKHHQLICGQHFKICKRVAECKPGLLIFSEVSQNDGTKASSVLSANFARVSSHRLVACVFFLNFSP